MVSFHKCARDTVDGRIFPVGATFAGMRGMWLVESLLEGSGSAVFMGCG